MKISSLLVWTITLSAMLPVMGHAEIYKWKDKDGSIRYSDVPPPSNIKNESIGKKIPKAPVTSVPASSVPADAGVAPAAAAKDAVPLSKEEAAAKQAKEAEAKKKANEAKQAELKFRQESCAAAKRDLAMYNSGGRMMTVDEKGERRYLSDEEQAKGKTDARQGVEKFCD